MGFLRLKRGCYDEKTGLGRSANDAGARKPPSGWNPYPHGMKSSVRLQAPAKLNLALAVGMPREDRMHPISSWMITVDLYDEVEIVQRSEQELSMFAVQWHDDALQREEIDWPLKKDLAARAHAALEEHVGRPLPVRMRIEKRIPLGSGLGGGSSDAAAVLRGTNELFELGMTNEELAVVAGSIGSDVPFLVHGGSAIVEGCGEQVDRMDDLPELHAVIAMPPIHCSTAAVFGWFDDICDECDGDHAMRDARDVVSRGVHAEDPFNDLAPAAFRTAPELEESVTRLEHLAERKVHISGSGSSLFVICDEMMHAEALARACNDQLGIPALPVTGCDWPAAAIR